MRPFGKESKRVWETLSRCFTSSSGDIIISLKQDGEENHLLKIIEEIHLDKKLTWISMIQFAPKVWSLTGLSDSG